MKRQKVTPSGGNVFADLGLPDADESLLKAKLSLRIVEIIRERRLSQTAAGKILEVDQPSVSALICGRLDGFSTERLFRFLNALGFDVEIFIRPKSHGTKRARVRVFDTTES